MAIKLNPPFRADHVGSLLRPSTLKQAFRAHQKGDITPDEFQEIQDASIRHVVALQEWVGLQSITDGEFRRVSYWAHFVEKVEGLAVDTAVYTFHDKQKQEAEFLAPHVAAKVQRTQSISGAEFDFLQNTTSQTAKITMPSPPTMHFWRGRQTLAANTYSDRTAYFADLSQVYRDEIADLAQRGAAYIQIDEVPLAMLCSPDVRQTVRDMGDDPDALIDDYIGLINDAVDGRTPEMTVAMHLCRGNFKGRWLSEGGYDYVSEKLFNEINVDAFFLEYDTPRAGDFGPLTAVPAHKIVVLGLVSSKTPELEPIDDLRRRIDEAAQYIPLNQLAISPQCGFASTVGGNPVSEDDEIRKLELVVKTANLVWNE
ncbi:MAG: 5-methyltetrahydropteroyltriglutamate--homocysteine S-methyltransferase [Chloroflexi bacterium]|nr:5-methyltetrahydropteroyltriglutamate--homocysteine S-methyltransferase [Chloroflexota bacterium]